MILKWCNSLTLGLIAIILLTADGRPRDRNRRQTNYGFKVIANSSFPCTSMTSTAVPASETHHEESSSPSKPLALTLDEIVKVMEKAHVSNDGALTAMTSEDTSSFPNLIPLAKEYKVMIKKLLDVDPHGVLLKREVVQYLEMMENDNYTDVIDFPSTDHVIRRRDVSNIYAPYGHTDKSTQEYCYARGTPTADPNYLYMCTVCSKTRDLGEGYWPRYVNEAECHEVDNQCLIVDVDSSHGENRTRPDNGVQRFHGKCQSIILPLNILERKEGYCALAMKDGQTIVVEDWQPTTEVINVGCECTVDVDSVFAYFV